jgi:hypothetical protein
VAEASIALTIATSSIPTSRFRMVWDTLRELAPGRATKRYLAILQ